MDSWEPQRPRRWRSQPGPSCDQSPRPPRCPCCHRSGCSWLTSSALCGRGWGGTGGGPGGLGRLGFHLGLGLGLSFGPFGLWALEISSPGPRMRTHAGWAGQGSHQTQPWMTSQSSPGALFHSHRALMWSFYVYTCQGTFSKVRNFDLLICSMWGCGVSRGASIEALAPSCVAVSRHSF